MSAAAARAISAEDHVAELDRVEHVVLDRVIHPGARDALADEDEQMRIAEWIVFRAATMKGGVGHHRIGESDRHACEQFAEHVADTSDVAWNDWISELAEAAEAWNGNADLCEPDAAPPRPVVQQCQRFAKHPADGFDG